MNIRTVGGGLFLALASLAAAEVTTPVYYRLVLDVVDVGEQSGVVDGVSRD